MSSWVARRSRRAIRDPLLRRLSVFAGAFEWPVIAGSHMLDDVEWAVMMIARRLDKCHAVSTLSPEGGTHATSTVLNTGCNLTQERLLRAC